MRQIISKIFNSNIDILDEYIENAPADEDDDFSRIVGGLIRTALFEKINRMREDEKDNG